jgi:type II secretory pathway component PulF
MPLYKYRAKDGPEHIVEGQIEAKNKEEAIEKINQMGYLPVRLGEEVVGRKQGKVPRSLFSAGLRTHDITIFSRQLASFLKSGMPILRALSIISAQSENHRLKDMIESIRAEVRDGKVFSAALAKFPRVFSPLYIAMVRTGEDSGTLPEALMRVVAYRQKQEEIFSRIRMALVYPAIMASVAIATIVFMFTFVMPRLMRIFSNIGEDLPLATKVLIAISTGFRQWWPVIILVGTVIFFIVKHQFTKAHAVRLSRLKLRLPLFGNLISRAELARFSRTLELLIRNGIPILKAIEVAIPTVNNELIRQQLRKSCKDLERGASFGKSLQKSALFPAFMSNLIIIGEESGQLDEALCEIANSYEKETEEAIKMMTTLLEPMIIFVMGAVVGFIVIAMLLPVFQINLMVK